MRDEFERWACSEGLISESHGVRFVNSMCDVARKAWEASRAAALEDTARLVELNGYDGAAVDIRALAKGGN